MKFLTNKIQNLIWYKNFINNNKKLFPLDYDKKKNKKSEILVEFNAFQNSHVPLSYLSNVLAKNYNSQINSFYNYSLISSPLKNTFLNEIKWIIGNTFSLKNFGVYRSFGVKKIFKPETFLKFDQKKLKKKTDSIYKKLKYKEDVLKIKINNILIGDLIYDTYLKKFIEPTIKIQDKKFYNLLKDFISLFEFWNLYFKKKNIKAVVGVHTPYSYGLILRMAINKNIPAYATSSRFIYSLSKKMPYMHGHFKIFKKTFSKFNYSLKKKAFNLAKKKLELRFKGIGGAKVDLISSEKSSFRSKKFQRQIIPSKKIKILITPHDFFDAAHIYGSTLFVDFYEWLKFLGKLSEVTDYDWYIKNRPNFNGKYKIYQPHTNIIIKEIINEFPKLKLLPNDYSHHQIIKEKIDFVLTCYGSVGVEYPYFGIPVINASKNNPHINYNFNFHPKTKNEYKNYLTNLSKIKKKKLSFSKKDIYEYYFMRNIYTDKNWLIEDLPKMIKYVGGYDGQWTNKFYDYWLDNLTDQKHEQVIKKIQNFVNSKDRYINMSHDSKF